jgi:hypothetical protein
MGQEEKMKGLLIAFSVFSLFVWANQTCNSEKERLPIAETEKIVSAIVGAKLIGTGSVLNSGDIRIRVLCPDGEEITIRVEKRRAK